MPILPSARVIFAVDLGIEDELGIGRAVQPAIGVDLAFELARRPTGIAEREQRLVGAGALGDVAQNVDGGGEADALVDRQRALGLEVVGAVQHEAASGLDRTAEMHRHAGQSLRQPDALLRRHDVELLEQLGETDIGRALVDDDAHGAVGRVRAHIDDRAGKARVAHRRHGDEQLAVEIEVALRRLLCATSWHETRL